MCEIYFLLATQQYRGGQTRNSLASNPAKQNLQFAAQHYDLFTKNHDWSDVLANKVVVNAD